MKKFIVAIALMLSATTAIAGPKFGQWEVDFENDLILNQVTESDGVTNVVIYKDGSFAAFYYPNSSPSEGFLNENIVRRMDSIMSVNGQNVKMKMALTSDNVIRIMAQTVRGQNFITSEFWSKRQVSFLVNGNKFTLSARGVQQAYSLLKQGGTAI